MILFFSGQYYAEIDQYIKDRLFSYFYTPPDKRTGALHVDLQRSIARGDRIFLDCGAFSAKTKGVEIDLNEYTDYCIKHEHEFFLMAALDVIGDADASYVNWVEQRRQGANVFPTYHYGEPKDFLRTLIAESDTIGLGGVAQLGTGPALMHWLDECWNELVDENGYPIRRIHGFGVTSLDAIKRYPWTFVDSTSWVWKGAMGLLVFFQKGDFFAVPVTAQNNTVENIRSKHWNFLSDDEKAVVIKLCEERGVDIEECRVHAAPRGKFNVETFKEFVDMVPKRLEYGQKVLF